MDYFRFNASTDTTNVDTDAGNQTGATFSRFNEEIITTAAKKLKVLRKILESIQFLARQSLTRGN